MHFTSMAAIRGRRRHTFAFDPNTACAHCTRTAIGERLISHSGRTRCDIAGTTSSGINTPMSCWYPCRTHPSHEPGARGVSTNDVDIPLLRMDAAGCQGKHQ